jgi:hypothetical protein
MTLKSLLMDRTRIGRLLIISSITTAGLFPLCMLFLAHSLLYVPTCHDDFSTFSKIPECQRVAIQLYAMWALLLVSALFALVLLLRWLYLRHRHGGHRHQELQPG